MFGCKLLPEMDSSAAQELGDERNLELKLWFDGAMLEAPFKGSKDFWLKTLKDLTMDSSAVPANDRVGSSFGQKQSDRGPAPSHAQGAYVLSVLELVCCLHNTVLS